MGSTAFHKIITAISFMFTFVASVHILIALWTTAWVRDLDSENSNYFERVRVDRRHQAFPTYETLFQQMGLWEIQAFGDEYYNLPIRDPELVAGSASLILSVVTAYMVYVTFTFQMLLREESYNKRLFLMVVSLWFSIISFLTCCFGTSISLWYIRQNFRFQRYGYSHNVAWIGFGLNFLAMIFSMLRFIIENKEMRKPKHVMKQRTPATLRSTYSGGTSARA